MIVQNLAALYVHVLAYLDDWLIQSESEAQCVTDTGKVLAVCLGNGLQGQCEEVLPHPASFSPENRRKVTSKVQLVLGSITFSRRM